MESRTKAGPKAGTEGIVAEIKEQHKKRDETIKLLRGVEAEVKKQCPEGPVSASTKTRVEDGKGGFLDAQTYARKLLTRKIVERTGDEELGKKVERLLALGASKEAVRERGLLGLELGESLTTLQKRLKELNIEARFFESDVMANAVSTMRQMLEIAGLHEYDQKEIKRISDLQRELWELTQNRYLGKEIGHPIDEDFVRYLWDLAKREEWNDLEYRLSRIRLGLDPRK